MLPTERGAYPAAYDAVAQAILAGGALPVTIPQATATLGVIAAVFGAARERRLATIGG